MTLTNIETKIKKTRIPMKRFLLLFLILCTLPIAAQVEKEVAFDFVNYQTLNPSIDMEGNSVKAINGITFTSGAVSLTSTIGSTGVSPAINLNAGGEGVCCLTIPRGSKITLKVNNDSELLKIDMRSMGFSDGTGGFTYSPTEGTLSFGIWTCDDIDGIRTMSFTNGTAKDILISGIKVTYRAPQDTFNYTSVSPSNNTSLTEFEGFTFKFDENVIIKDGATFTLKKNTTVKNVKLNPTVDGKIVTLVPESLVTETGTYTLNVEKGVFIAPDGSYNKAFTTSFTLKDKEDTFIYSSVNPETGEIKEIPTSIYLTFPEQIGNEPSMMLSLKNVKGEEVRKLSASRNAADNYKSLTLSFTNEMGPVTAKGIYTITVPAKYVYNNDYNDRAADKGVSAGARYNPEFTLQYKVGGADMPTEETIAKAKAVLAMTGIGYPVQNAAERTNLEELVTKAEQEFTGSDAEMKDAIEAYFKCTNVLLPTSNKYYTLANVANDENKTKHYLTYSQGKIILSKEVSDAESFLISEHDGKLILKTSDGKFLHSLVNSNRYSAVTTTNVSDTYNPEVNDLEFKPLTVDNVDAETTFGLFSMYGYIGKKNGNDKFIYSLVDTANGTIDIDDGGDKYFDVNNSSAFVFAEATSPDPVTQFSLTPEDKSVVDELSMVTVVIKNASKIDYDNTKQIVITSESGAEKFATNIKVKGNTLTFNTGITNNGVYSIVIPKGTLTYYSKDHTVLVPEIKATYTVASDDVFNYDFDVRYHLYTSILDDKKYKSEDMNHFYIYTTDTEFFINKDVNHSYVINFDNLNPICDGHLAKRSTYESEYKDVYYRDNVRMGIVESVADGIYFLDNGERMRYDSAHDKIVNEEIRHYTYCLDLVFDMTFTEKNLPNARYLLGIERGSYGDATFGIYLQNSKIVAKHDCHLNERQLFYFDVDNSTSGIYDATTKLSNIHKYVKNGKVVITNGGKTYNLAGQVVE